SLANRMKAPWYLSASQLDNRSKAADLTEFLGSFSATSKILSSTPDSWYSIQNRFACSQGYFHAQPKMDQRVPRGRFQVTGPWLPLRLSCPALHIWRPQVEIL